MKPRRLLAIATSLILLTGLCARAEIKTLTERNDTGAAGFKFQSVPAPVKTSAASKGKFIIVDGARDQNGGDVDQLGNGALPRQEDQPDANFFFGQGSDGGRLALDLGRVVDIKQVNTYSWHPVTRGPQVYKLYAADAVDKDFNAQPKKSTDPEKCGWKLISTVDTRPKQGEPGGQYGVSISDSTGIIGKYRYLLFDISRTEATDPFGNTFYSKINVIDAAAPAVDAPAQEIDPNTGKLVVLTAEPEKYEITINYSETPEMKEWIETKLAPTLVKWYPLIVKDLPSDGFTAPQRFTVVFRKDMAGVANTSRGTLVTCAAPWFNQNLNGEAVGAVVHELVHVAQQYRSRGNPGWLVEGIADYLRWFKYEPATKRPRPNPARNKYTDSYRVTAAFLNYLTEKHDKDIVVKFNAAMRQGKYTAELWKEFTGKTVDELWEEYMATLKK